MTNPDNTQNVQIEKQESIVKITLNRPEKKNALTQAMYSAMLEAIQEADNDTSTRVTLITGSEDCFTSGNDVKDFLNAPTGSDFLTSPVAQFLMTISSAKKPIVAAINGPAIGVGTTMLLHCDLVFAGANSKLQMPFVNLGVCPEAGSSLLLPKFIGHVKAAELLLLGKVFSGQEAYEMGLVNTVCDNPADVLPMALEACNRLAAQPPSAVRLAKELIKRPYADQLKQTIVEEGDEFIKRVKSPEAMEAFQAFLQKRPADFSKFS